MDKPEPDHNSQNLKNSEKKVNSNGKPEGDNHSLSTELNDLIFDLVDAIHQMGIPVRKEVPKAK